VESLALSILRLVEEEAMKEYTGQVLVQVPSTVANFLLNEKRKALSQIESRHSVPVLILANEYMERPKFEIDRVRRSEVTDVPSYERIEEPSPETATSGRGGGAAAPAAAPAVTGVMPARPVPTRETKEKEKPGFFGHLFARLFSTGEEEEETKEPRAPSSQPARRPEPPQQRQAAQEESKESGAQGRGGRHAAKKKRPRKPTESGKQADGQKPAKKQPRKKRGGKKRSRRPEEGSRSDAQATERGTESRADNRDKDGGGEPDDRGDSASRKSRRRRSPYKTGGRGTPRDGKPEESAYKQDAAAEQPKPAAEQSRPAAEQSRPAAEQSRPAAEQSKPAAEQSRPPAEQPKPAAEQSKPAAEQSKPAAEQRQAAPAPADSPQRGGPAVQVTREASGIYTLKPADKEKVGQSAPASEQPKTPEKTTESATSDQGA